MLLPDQPTIKLLLGIKPEHSPYVLPKAISRARAYLDSMSTLTCEHCGLSFDATELTALVEQTLGDGYKSEHRDVHIESIFRFSWNIDGLQSRVVDSDSGEILCRACFELENCMNPLSPYALGHGGFGLYGSLSQSDIMNLWRGLIASSQKAPSVAAALGKSWSAIYREATGALTRALYDRKSDTATTPSAKDLCEWAGSTMIANWEAFQTSLTDFRFLPPQHFSQDLLLYAVALTRTKEFKAQEFTV